MGEPKPRGLAVKYEKPRGWLDFPNRKRSKLTRTELFIYVNGSIYCTVRID
jgi:hypothetical protein